MAQVGTKLIDVSAGTDKEGKPIVLQMTEAQKRFCELYVLSDDFSGNGVQCYMEAYQSDSDPEIRYKTARVNASKLLTDTNLLTYMTFLMEDLEFNSVFADQQLAFLMKQNDDKHAKLGAIKHHNALKQRITKKLEVQKVPTIDPSKYTPEELKTLLDLLEKGEE